MYFGENFRALNQLYKIVKGNGKGITAWQRETVIPLAYIVKDDWVERYEITAEQAYDIACSSFNSFCTKRKMISWADICNFMLVHYNYSSTMIPMQNMHQEKPLIVGSFRHGMNVARESRWKNYNT